MRIFLRYGKKRTAVMAFAAALNLAILSLAGCGAGTAPGAGIGNQAAGSMESTPVIDYTVPNATPNILVDQAGYPAGGEKKAVVKGSKMPESFRLIDSATGEIVYSAAVEPGTYDPKQKVYIGYASFGQIETEGEYYLECDAIGRSYSFAVKDSLYQELFEELCAEMEKGCREQTAIVEDALALLLAYEWYGAVFPDEDQNDVPDVMETLSEWISGIDYARIDVAEGASYAAFLGKFSYLYQKFDLEYATECLQRASSIFSQTQNTPQKDAENFFALTELYRATGLYTYRNQILEYKTYFQNNSSFLEEPAYLYGAMTYMVTRQKVDFEMCNLFMDQLLARGEEIAGLSKDLLHPVNARNNGEMELLQCAVELSCANYVLDSYQYDSITEEFLHYLMGRNFQSVRFLPEKENRDVYLLFLAHLASIQV